MRFDSRRRVPQRSGWGGQNARIVFLLVMLVLTFAAIRTAGRSKTWEWMGNGREGSASAPSQMRGKEGAEPGEIVIDLSPVGASPRRELAMAARAEEAEATEKQRATSAAGVNLDVTRLALVQDNTRLRQRPQEAEAYYYVLDRARGADAQELDARARRDVTFPQLLSDPQAYRGQLVSLEGVVHRLITYPAGANDYGLNTLYEAWLFTSDSQNHPLIVVCTRVPEGFPSGDRLTQRVRVTGYFFKNNAYSAGDADRIAPLVLAQRLVWLRPAAEGSSAAVWVWVVFSAVAVPVAVVWWSRRRSRGGRLGAVSHDEIEHLRQLSEGSAYSEDGGAGPLAPEDGKTGSEFSRQDGQEKS